MKSLDTVPLIISLGLFSLFSLPVYGQVDQEYLQAKVQLASRIVEEYGWTDISGRIIKSLRKESGLSADQNEYLKITELDIQYEAARLEQNPAIRTTRISGLEADCREAIEKVDKESLLYYKLTYILTQSLREKVKGAPQEEKNAIYDETVTLLETVMEAAALFGEDSLDLVSKARYEYAEQLYEYGTTVQQQAKKEHLLNMSLETYDNIAWQLEGMLDQYEEIADEVCWCYLGVVRCYKALQKDLVEVEEVLQRLWVDILRQGSRGTIASHIAVLEQLTLVHMESQDEKKVKSAEKIIKNFQSKVTKKKQLSALQNDQFQLLITEFYLSLGDFYRAAKKSDREVQKAYTTADNALKSLRKDTPFLSKSFDLKTKLHQRRGGGAVSIASELFVEADLHLRNGKFQEAIDSFRRVLHIGTPNERLQYQADCWYKMGYSYWKLQDNFSAGLCFDQVVKVAPQDSRAADSSYYTYLYLSLGLQGMMKETPQIILQAAERFVTHYPTHPQVSGAAYKLGSSLYRKKKLGKAIEYLQLVSEKDKLYFSSQYLLCFTLWKKYQEISSNEAETTDEEKKEYLKDAILALSDFLQWSKKNKELVEQEDYIKKVSDITYRLGSLYASTKEYEKVIATLGSYKESFPTVQAPAFLNMFLLQAYCGLFKEKEARATLDNILEQKDLKDADYKKAWRLMAIMYNNMMFDFDEDNRSSPEYNRLLQLLTKAKEESGTLEGAEASLAGGRVFKLQQNWKDAIDQFEKIISENPNPTEVNLIATIRSAHKEIVDCYEQQDLLHDAIEAQNRLIEFTKNLSESGSAYTSDYEKLAQIYRVFGLSKDASDQGRIDALQEAKKIYNTLKNSIRLTPDLPPEKAEILQARLWKYRSTIVAVVYEMGDFEHVIDITASLLDLDGSLGGKKYKNLFIDKLDAVIQEGSTVQRDKARLVLEKLKQVN